MSYLSVPAQVPTQNTYYGRAGTQLFIDRMKNADEEAVVSRIWVDILTWIFPSNNFYSVRPEQFTDEGPTDLCVLQLMPINGQRREYDFLVVQCKRPNAESQNAVWDGAMDQIIGYLRNLKPTNAPYRVYGVVAVGRWAQFVEYDGQTDSLIALNGHTGKYHIARQCRSVQRLLEYIEANH